MAERIEALITGQRRLLGDISHELRSPLSRLIVALSLVKQGPADEAAENLEAVSQNPETRDRIHPDWLSEVVNDKGYHSNDTLVTLKEHEIRSYTSEPDRGRRNWNDKKEERDAVYANRMQITGHGPIVRLSFGEGMGGTDFHYRAAIAMTINDAKEMAEAILNIVNQAVMTKVEPPKTT